MGLSGVKLGPVAASGSEAHGLDSPPESARVYAGRYVSIPSPVPQCQLGRGAQRWGDQGRHGERKPIVPSRWGCLLT